MVGLGFVEGVEGDFHCLGAFVQFTGAEEPEAVGGEDAGFEEDADDEEDGAEGVEGFLCG